MTTRAGKKMAVIDFEDLHGHIEVAIFSRLYDQIKDTLQEENVILLTGKVESSDENVHKLIAFNVYLLPKKNTTKKVKEPEEVFITLKTADEANDWLLEKIKEIIDICPGNIRTNVDLHLGGFSYRLDRTPSISYEGVKQLRKQPGILVMNQPQ
jgi:DNA polymerase-3 subunit alpha